MRASLGNRAYCTLAAVALSSLAWPMKSVAGEWEFKLAPLFLWGISLDADATIGTETVPLDLSFEDDVIENMDTVFTFHFEAKNDDLILFAEYQYVKLDPSLSIGPVDADVEFENTAIELGAGWEFSRSERIGWEMLLGLRYLDQDVDVDGTLNLPEPPNGPGALPLAVAGGDDWYHPFLGLRGDYKFGSRWSLLGRGDYGYSDSDNSLLNLSLMFDYRFKQWGSAFIGWRYQDVNYDSGSGDDQYGFDGVQQGPLVGLTLYW
ncbi:MAG: hypothetical protein ABJ056_12025 [Halioglobus sp.]